MNGNVENPFTVEFEYNVSSNDIYASILPQLRDYFVRKRQTKDLGLVWSFINTRYISASALPLLLTIGEELFDDLHEPTHIELQYTPELLYFLHTSSFFQTAKKFNLFSYQEEFVGGFGQSIGKQYRKDHVMHVFQKDPVYGLLPPSEKTKYRQTVVDNAITYLLYSGFNTVANDLDLFRDKTIFSSCYGEIVANAILHSNSRSYLFAQSNKYGTEISISDRGIGLKSLDNKEKDHINPNMYSSIRKNNNNFERHATLLAILDMLEYSRLASIHKIETADLNRNLWTIWNHIMDADGSIWIHTLNVRVKFDGHYCKRKCKMSSFGDCVNCLLSKGDYRYVTYPASHRGLHIEIHLPKLNGGN